VIAVEPDDAMRAKIDGDARAGSAESIPVADVSVDAVFVGDAFHWFDAPVALREIRRVLRGGGGLALLSNHWPIPEDGEARRLLDEVWRRFHGDTRFEATWVAELEQALGPFERAVFERELVLDNEAYAELCVTGSCPSALPDDERELLRRGLAANFDAVVRLTAPVEAWWVRT
jgi:SAM-dependent methyltransferase